MHTVQVLSCRKGALYSSTLNFSEMFGLTGNSGCPWYHSVHQSLTGYRAQRTFSPIRFSGARKHILYTDCNVSEWSNVIISNHAHLDLTGHCRIFGRRPTSNRTLHVVYHTTTRTYQTCTWNSIHIAHIRSRTYPKDTDSHSVLFIYCKNSLPHPHMRSAVTATRSSARMIEARQGSHLPGWTVPTGNNDKRRLMQALLAHLQVAEDIDDARIYRFLFQESEAINNDLKTVKEFRRSDQGQTGNISHPILAVRRGQS